MNKCQRPHAFYAHSLPNEPPDKWQPLEEHLKNVAELAAGFARPFGGEKWAYLAGLWHDLGKYSNAFQAKLLRENGIETTIESTGRVIHSDAGGHLASLKGWKGADRVLSWLIMGHHSGLADFLPDETGARALSVRMKDPKQSSSILENVPDWLKNQPMPRQPIPKGASPSFFIRMLFSCIVDADFLDTEKFMDRGRAKKRNYEYPSLKLLCENFMEYMEQLIDHSPKTPVNSLRRQVFEWCIREAQNEPNIFSLTVPTGGGKTLASLAFSLNHAIAHAKNRIIYVIPFTNIIEQTASVFRRIPNFESAVLEHHSNLVEDDSEMESRIHLRLATENWDAPLVVTTAVQFFESLYSCKSSRCRRLHNIVNSVVIFDEAQCIPPGFLRPIVFAIKELAKYYNVTPLFCTATQPVLARLRSVDFDLREGFETEPIEIVPDPEDLSQRLKRVRFQLVSKRLTPLSHDELAEILDKEESSLLCIVNRKEDARRLASLIRTGRVFHLSTNMCPEHRSDVLSKVKRLLDEKTEILRVVSTSLVEAGVDLDFPVVYRAIAGLDSIIQAAGRCNREGKLKEPGRLVVFRPSKQPSYVRQQASLAQEYLCDPEYIKNLQKNSVIRSYFKKWYWQLGLEGLDRKEILKLLGGNHLNYYFRTASDRFCLIEDRQTTGVLVPYGHVMELVARLSTEPWNLKRLIRKLQRYSVNVFQDQLNELIQKGLLHGLETSENGHNLYMVDKSVYHKDFGLVHPEDSIPLEPEDFIV